MIPDVEAVLHDYLAAELADLGTRVVGRTPRDTAHSWVKVIKIDAPGDGTDADHLIAAYVQFDCYAGAANEQAEANTLGGRVREALRTIAGQRSGATVTGSKINGDSRIPDPALEPERERVVVTAAVWLHA